MSTANHRRRRRLRYYANAPCSILARRRCVVVASSLRRRCVVVASDPQWRRSAMICFAAVQDSRRKLFHQGGLLTRIDEKATFVLRVAAYALRTSIDAPLDASIRQHRVIRARDTSSISVK